MGKMRFGCDWNWDRGYAIGLGHGLVPGSDTGKGLGL